MWFPTGSCYLWYVWAPSDQSVSIQVLVLNSFRWEQEGIECGGTWVRNTELRRIKTRWPNQHCSYSLRDILVLYFLNYGNLNLEMIDWLFPYDLDKCMFTGYKNVQQNSQNHFLIHFQNSVAYFMGEMWNENIWKTGYLDCVCVFLKLVIRFLSSWPYWLKTKWQLMSYTDQDPSWQKFDLQCAFQKNLICSLQHIQKMLEINYPWRQTFHEFSYTQFLTSLPYCHGKSMDKWIHWPLKLSIVIMTHSEMSHEDFKVAS